MSLKIVVPDDFPAAFTGSSAEPRLRGLGTVTVHTERGADQEAELIRRIGDAEVVVNIRAHARFTDRVLAGCPSLRLISIWGTGTDNVDLAACRTRGVAVTNTPGVNAHAVAEHTLALMLAVTRRIPAMDRDTRAGQWPRGQLIQLEGRTVGLIGLGAIGAPGGGAPGAVRRPPSGRDLRPGRRARRRGSAPGTSRSRRSSGSRTSSASTCASARTRRAISAVTASRS